MLPGSRPLKNRKKENFCQLYAGDYWGCPGDAWKKVSSRQEMQLGEFRHEAERLLEDSAVRARLEYLRQIRAKNSVADNAWIKESLVHIAQESGKDSDRIRALASLNRILASEQRQEEKRREREEDHDNSCCMPEAFPLFEGLQDGSGIWDADSGGFFLKGEEQKK